MADTRITVLFPGKAFWALQPLISREIAAVSRRTRATGDVYPEYLQQLQQCLGAVSSAMREFHEQQKGMFHVTEAPRIDDEAAP